MLVQVLRLSSTRSAMLTSVRYPASLTTLRGKRIAYDVGDDVCVTVVVAAADGDDGDDNACVVVCC